MFDYAAVRATCVNQLTISSEIVNQLFVGSSGIR